MEYRILFADQTELRIIVYDDSTGEARYIRQDEEYTILVTKQPGKQLAGLCVASEEQAPDNDVLAAAAFSESGFINILRAICNAADNHLISNANPVEHDARIVDNEADEMIQCIGFKRQDSIIGRICAFMLDNMDNKNIMELAADEFGISKDHIRRIFKVKLGMTCNEVLIRLKIERAKKLLRETTEKIYEISESVGYTSVDYFTNVFKRIEGMTPMQYRMNEGFLQNTTGRCRDSKVSKIG